MSQPVTSSGGMLGLQKSVLSLPLREDNLFILVCVNFEIVGRIANPTTL